MREEDIKEFAAFAHLVQSCHKNAGIHKQQLEYISSLFEASVSIYCLCKTAAEVAQCLV